MKFAYPWVFIAAALGLIVAILRSKSVDAYAVPALSTFSSIRRGWRSYLRPLCVHGSWILAFCCIALAAARPQLLRIQPQAEERRNLMLALDVSGSMRTRDFASHGVNISRLAAVKMVVEDFVKMRPNDRLGLVVFGTQAYLQCPLTNDHNILTNLVRKLDTGLVGDGTAIGEGLGLALKRLDSLPPDSKAIILLTDGVNTAGTIHPRQAAQVAHDLGIKVYTIGIGSAETEQQMKQNSFYNAPAIQFAFDAELLKEIAAQSGGQYFKANNLEELSAVYAAIDQLESSAEPEPERLIVEELYLRFVLAGLAFMLCFLVFKHLLFNLSPSIWEV